MDSPPLHKKKYKRVFNSFEEYKAWKVIFEKIKHVAVMEVVSGKVYISY